MMILKPDVALERPAFGCAGDYSHKVMFRGGKQPGMSITRPRESRPGARLEKC